MSYNTIEFFVFLIIFLSVYLIVPGIRPKQLVIFIGNIIFYYYAGLDKLFIVVGVSIIVYTTSRILEYIYAEYDKNKEGLTPKEQLSLLASYKKRCRLWLWISLTVIIGMLVYVKIGRLRSWKEVETFSDFALKKIIVPLGISYYTFSSVGYLLDIYWRKVKCHHNYFKLLTCMMYFPHIVQGPIGHYDKIIKQFEVLPKYDNKRVCFGIQLLLWGMFKKMVVADRLVLFTETIFRRPAKFAGVEIFIAVVLSAIQIYADFSGCMDMVCGVSQVMGVTLEENFKRPFFSRSAPEFWRRWHITLSTWYKDYILMPIATNPKFMKRATKIRKKRGIRASQLFSTAVPAIAVWILTGMWHGTGKSYIVWGLYWGTLIILSTVLAPEMKKVNEFFDFKTESFGFRVFQMTRTFFLFCIGRMFTVTGSLRGCLLLWKRLFAESRYYTLFDGSLYKHGLDQKNFYVVLFGMTLMWLASIMQERGLKVREEIAAMPLVFRWLIYYGAIFLVLIFGMYGPGYDASNFVYGNF